MNDSNFVDVFRYEEPNGRGSIKIVYSKNKKQYRIKVREIHVGGIEDAICVVPKDVWEGYLGISEHLK